MKSKKWKYTAVERQLINAFIADVQAEAQETADNYRPLAAKDKTEWIKGEVEWWDGVVATCKMLRSRLRNPQRHVKYLEG